MLLWKDSALDDDVRRERFQKRARLSDTPRSAPGDMVHEEQLYTFLEDDLKRHFKSISDQANFVKVCHADGIAPWSLIEYH